MSASEEESTITWYPSHLLSPTPPTPQTPLSLIILNQPLALCLSIYQAIFSRAKHIVAADGGANRLYDLSHAASSPASTSSIPCTVEPQSLNPTLIIGDLDSLLSPVRNHYSSKGIEIIKDGDQYSTDFGKAHSWLLKQQENEAGNEEQDIVVLGGLGGRVDQGLSVLHHLYMFQTPSSYSQGKMYLISSESITFLLKRGCHKIKVRDSPYTTTTPEDAEKVGGGNGRSVKWGLGKHVGIIPVKEACVITTEGLEWDVKDWKTEFGGMMSTSNWVRDEWVHVETSGDVVFTIDIKVEEEEKQKGAS